MRVRILLLTGLSLLLFRGNIVLPSSSVAQAPLISNYNENYINQKNQLLSQLISKNSANIKLNGITNKAIIRALMIRPRKRDPQVTLKAIQAVKRRKSALLAKTTKLNNSLRKNRNIALLPVVNQNNILFKHRKLANEVLRSLPWGCQRTLKNFYVRYDNPSRRGLAGKTSIILDGNVPDEEFKALLIHEFGHITDLGCKIGTPNFKPSNFKDGAETIYLNDPSVKFYEISWINSKTKRINAKPEDFVSGYASWDPFEDFAETYTYFVLQNDAFKKRARTNHALTAKYRWMVNNIFRGYPLIAKGKHVWTGDVPWDTTKLAFVWLNNEKIADQ